MTLEGDLLIRWDRVGQWTVSPKLNQWHLSQSGLQERDIFYFLKEHHSERFMTVLKWGWVFLERMRILSGIQLTTQLIEFLVVETKRFVGSFVNVIFTRQTCSQRSSRAVESKRRALGSYFSE